MLFQKTAISLWVCPPFIVLMLIMVSVMVQPDLCVNKVLGDDKPHYLSAANDLTPES